MFLVRRSRSFPLKYQRRNNSLLGIFFQKSPNDGSERVSDETQIQKIVNMDNIYTDTRRQIKQPERRNLVKCFFVEEVDKDQLAFPQVIEHRDYEDLTKKLKPIDLFFKERAKTVKDPTVRDLSDDLVADIRAKKLFGTSVNMRFGGLGYFTSETALASECDAVDVKFNEVLSAHRIACETIYYHGTDSQRIEYLLDMAKGKKIATVVPHEIRPRDGNKVRAVFDTSEEKATWILNGKKTFVVKSRHANFLIVSAEAVEESEYIGGESSTEIHTYIIDANAPGVKFQDISDTLGCNEVPYATLELENVRVGSGEPNLIEMKTPFEHFSLLDNHLAEKHEHWSAANRLLHGSRLSLAVLKSVQARKVLDNLVDHTIHSSYRNVPLL